MKNIADILRKAGQGSLVLLDEIGTGTDPREGAALAAAVLDFLYRKGCVTLATTHYGDLKAYSEGHPGFVNGSMEFDEETLKPLYKLVIGQPGQSQGLIIAKRLGLMEEVVQAAEDYVRSMSGGDIPREAAPKPSAPPSPPKAEVVRLALPTGTASEPVPETPREKAFLVGDSVFVRTVKERGIVAKEPDERGNVIVLVRGRRISVHRKRLKLLVKREDLYPGEDYDLNIVLMSKKDRKLMKTMSKRHTDEVRVIEPDPEPR